MASDARRSRSGQAMAEFVVALLAMVLVIVAAVEFAPVFLDNFNLLKDVREEAGVASVTADQGVASADRREEFELDVPELLLDRSAAEGEFSEKMRMPSANLALYETVHLPSVAGFEETMRQAANGGTVEFVSARTTLLPGEAIGRAEAALAGAGWTPSAIAAPFSRIFTSGDPLAPSAVAAANATEVRVEKGDGSFEVFTVVTMLARTAGATL